MKKNYLLGMALIASLSFYSCDKEVVYVQDGNGVESVADGAQIITLQVENGGDGLTTRAGRPLYSSEAKQTIENVRLWIFDNAGTLKYSTTLGSWNSTGSTEYGESNEHGREAKITLSGDNKLETGSDKTYTVYAIGYHTSSNYTGIPSETGVTESQVKDVKLTYGGSDNAEEIFAGSLEIDLTSATSTGFKKTIVLNRQVAGAFVYVEEIPFVSAGHKYLKLIASAKSSDIVLGNFANKEYTSNGANTSTNVVNGTETTAGDVVISCIDLTQWFGGTLSDKDGLIDATNWTNAIDKTGTGNKETTFQKGSVFGGTFLIPFAKQDSKQTLKLVLSTSNAATSVAGDVVWNINLPTGDNQLQSSFALTTPSVAGASVTWPAGSATAETANIYSILRNHLYGVGKRTLDNPGNGTDPTPDPDPDPSTDPDVPESLNNKQELTLRVNDNWEVIHGMELE